MGQYAVKKLGEGSGLTEEASSASEMVCWARVIIHSDRVVGLSILLSPQF